MIAVKDSAIASVIAVPELMHQSQILAGITYRALRDLHRRDGPLFRLSSTRSRGGSTGSIASWRIWGRRDLRLVGRSGTNYRTASCEGAGLTIMLAVADHGARHSGRAAAGGPAAEPLRRLVRVFATAFVEFFRATPLILQIYWAFYVLPATFGIGFQISRPALRPSVCNVSSFNSETFRAGILSIRQGRSMPGSPWA